MKNFNKTVIILFILLATQSCSLIHTSPLPLAAYLPNDPYWEQDARQANANINHFIEPSDDTNYTDYRYVGTHNAFTYPHFFKIVRQQDQSIIGQLSYGVRGLMLDTYDWKLSWPSSLQGATDAKVCLSHGTPGNIATVAQKGTLKYQSLKYEIRRILEFMKANPQAVVTIILEDYANPTQTAQEINDAMTYAKYNPLFKPTDLMHGEWPTLGWMRQNNKRLVIFTQRAASADITFNQFSYMMENKYGTINKSELCSPRPESQPSGMMLLAFNNFKNISFFPTTKDQCDYTAVKKIITSCTVQNFANGKIFNGYWANHVINKCDCLYTNKNKTVFEYVNELNANPDKTAP